ncbi:Bromo-adjacent domain-containing protein, putative isoform 1 [Hibiscus syriacus]|uniref:Bromo-adjacent domain-containing protein, putative isoform 1 n=1 Tax=Hibiscus syriacus TaxID=106335 RepID=A0A6A3ABX2_HIBSY|nr:Bromo-adjacent domain-containing protein, putative isoform 1 [Hibiscus syriacus]
MLPSKERKWLMKEAVAAAQSGYANSLKNTGAALSDYGHGEAEVPLLNPDHIPPLDSTPQPPPPPPMMDSLPPLPPLPNFTPNPVPIKRSVSMPAMPVESRKEFDASFAIEEQEEEDEEEDDDDEEEHRDRNDDDDNNNKEYFRNESRGPLYRIIVILSGVNHPPLMPEAKNVACDYFFMVDDSMPGPSLDLDDDDNECASTNVDSLENNVSDVGFSDHGGVDNLRRMAKAVSGVNLMEVLNEIDDHFLKASESAQEVSKILETTRLIIFVILLIVGHTDHSERVLRVITWNRSVRGTTNGENRKGEFDSEECETHANILEKLLAWEKKLYEEVKQGELVKLEYKRKLASLNKQKKHGASAESLERTKAAVSHLHTRYIVDMQSMDSTVVNRIRDEQLYHKLFILVDCQLKIVEKLKSLDIAFASKETTKHHHERTIQLHDVVQEWHSQFDKLNPTIKTLLQTWYDGLEKLPDEVAKSATSSFAAVIKTIIIHQEEEMKLKERCEDTRKEFLRKNQAYEEWYHKHNQRRSVSDGTDAERGEDEMQRTRPCLRSNLQLRA